MNDLFRGLRLVLPTLFVLGCAHVPSPPMPALASEVLPSVRLGRADLKTLKAEARAELTRGKRVVRFHVSVLAAEPDRLFVETSGFGLPASLVSVRGAHVEVYVPSRGEFYRGEDENSLTNLLGIPLRPRLWVELLLGRFPDLSGPAGSVLRRGDQWVVETGQGLSPKRLKIDAGKSWLVSAIDPTPEVSEIRFGKPMATASGRYPSEITVTAPGVGHLRLRFSSVVSNPAISEEDFSLTPPQGLLPRSIADMTFSSPEPR